MNLNKIQLKNESSYKQTVDKIRQVHRQIVFGGILSQGKTDTEA